MIICRLLHVALLTCLFAPASLYALDFGVQGPVFRIEEPSLLDMIMNRLNEMDSNGELEALEEEMVQTTKDYVLRPYPVEGLGNTDVYTRYEVDLTITVDRDLSDHRGVVFAHAGTVVNPLDYSIFDQRLIFIDGDDSEHVDFALGIASEHAAKIILVRGEPITLSNLHRVPFWFDQSGVLVARFLIQNVPAVVSRGYPNMIVEEIPLEVSE